jgi:5-methylcytosine-specific restriction endonuclease McrA
MNIFYKSPAPSRGFRHVPQEDIDRHARYFHKAYTSCGNAHKRCEKSGARYEPITAHVFWLLVNSTRCYFCGKSFANDADKTVDHLIPISRGGGHVIGNVVVACGHCNDLKGDMSKVEYMRVTRSWRKIVGVRA